MLQYTYVYKEFNKGAVHSCIIRENDAMVCHPNRLQWFLYSEGTNFFTVRIEINDEWQGITQFSLFFLRCWRKVINEILKYHTSICVGWLYLGVRRMEMTLSNLEADFSKSFEVWKFTKFVFLVQLRKSRFYFKSTHINALFSAIFHRLRKVIWKHSKM